MDLQADLRSYVINHFFVAVHSEHHTLVMDWLVKEKIFD